jgi:hypothetical protein
MRSGRGQKYQFFFFLFGLFLEREKYSSYLVRDDERAGMRLPTKHTRDTLNHLLKELIQSSPSYLLIDFLLKRSVLSIISGSHPAATGSALLRHP